MAYWDKYGGACGDLRLPLMDDQSAATSPSGTTGSYQRFEGGTIHSSKFGTFVTRGNLLNVYNSNGGSGKHGFPTGEMYKDNRGIWCQRFDFGNKGLCEDGPEVEPAGVEYSEVDGLHVLIVDLFAPLEVCMRPQISLNGEIGEKDAQGNLKKDYKMAPFSEIVSDKNVQLNGYKPIAAFNTDYVEVNGQPLDTNYIQGYNYSGGRGWTSMTVGKDNEIGFTNSQNNSYYNVVGGGPKIFTNGAFSDPCNAIGYAPCRIQKSRTVVGITDNNKMIVIVADSLDTDQIDKKLIDYARDEGGTIKEGNMFDGGSSPGMMYDGNIKRQGSNLLTAAMLIFKGDACKFR